MNGLISRLSGSRVDGSKVVDALSQMCYLALIRGFGDALFSAVFAKHHCALTGGIGGDELIVDGAWFSGHGCARLVVLWCRMSLMVS